MIKDIRYKFEDFKITENENELSLIASSENYDFSRRCLFSSMLNFGYISFEPGVFSVTAKDIVGFWEYANTTVLKDYTIESYYSLLNIDPPYTERVPCITTEGSFHSNDFNLSVAWIKINSNMYSAPIALEQKGLKLKDQEYGDVIGSLYPEFFELYYIIDKANTKWKEWGNKEKYDFLEELEQHSKKRNFEIPKNLKELLNKHKNEEK